MPPETLVRTNVACGPPIHHKKIEMTPVLPIDKTYRTLWGRFKMPLIWSNIILITLVHILTILGLTTFPFFDNKMTVLWGFITGWAGGFGITAGAHRLWTHRSYKATLPLRIILMICYAIAGQNRLLDWVKDHRVHHKFSETDADPHNANRGFFFAHVGWLMMKKHPEVIRKGKQIDYSDLYEDPVFRFYEKYFWEVKLTCCFVIPIAIPYYCWNETFYWSIMSCITRYTLGLNFTWSVNSAAHIFGNKPYDKKIQPSENLIVSMLAMGEGWHNYHHTFPWDYKAAELGNYSVNATTCLLDIFAKIGWAYDLKTPSKELVENMVKNHGDGSHSNYSIKEIRLFEK